MSGKVNLPDGKYMIGKQPRSDGAEAELAYVALIKSGRVVHKEDTARWNISSHFAEYVLRSGFWTQERNVNGSEWLVIAHTDL